jgi:hypothetical protein
LKKREGMMNENKRILLKEWECFQDGHFDKRVQRKHKKAALKIECNLCSKIFVPFNKYERFCQLCREESDLLR